MSSNGGALFARADSESLSNRTISVASDRTSRTPQNNGALIGATSRISKSARAIGVTESTNWQLRAASTCSEKDSEESSGFVRLSNETPPQNELLAELSGGMHDKESNKNESNRGASNVRTSNGRESNGRESNGRASNGRDESKEFHNETNKVAGELNGEVKEFIGTSNKPRASETVQMSIDESLVCIERRERLLSERKEFDKDQRSDHLRSSGGPQQIKSLDSVCAKRSIGSLESSSLSGKQCEALHEAPCEAPCETPCEAPCEASSESSTNAFGEWPSQPAFEWPSGELPEHTSACWRSTFLHGNSCGGSPCERSSIGSTPSKCPPSECTPFAKRNGPEASGKPPASRLRSKSELKKSCSLSANHFDLILIIQFLLLATSQHVHCQQPGGVFPSNQFK